MKSKDFFEALEALQVTKGIEPELFIEALRNALIAAYKKQYECNSSEVDIRIDPEKNTIKYYSVKIAVEKVQDDDKEILLSEAKELKKSYKLGDRVLQEFIPKEFGRIAAQTARQVIFQKLNEAERDQTYHEYNDKRDALMTCVVQKLDDKSRTVYLELLGSDEEGKVEGILPPQEQLLSDKYAIGNKFKMYVKYIKNSGKNTQVLLSRTDKGLVKKLFENQVPEIQNGSVVIKSVSREAGGRSKIAIASTDPAVDAVGACVGNKGSRVNAIVEELGGEKIDIILWSENPLEFIAKALSPAKVLSVTETGDKTAVAIVPDDKLSLAIGKDGQNAKLAARLTGWKIDIKNASSVIGTEYEAHLPKNNSAESSNDDTI